MDSKEERFLIAFLEDDEAAHGMLNELILERIEGRLVQKLAEKFPVKHADDNSDGDEDGENGSSEDGDKKKRKRRAKVVLGGKTDVDTHPETAPVSPKDLEPPKMSEGLLSAVAKYVAGRLATNAGVDTKLISAIRKGLSGKRKPKPTAKKVLPQKQKSVLPTNRKKPESKLHQSSGEPEKMDRAEFAKRLKASGNDLRKMGK